MFKPLSLLLCSLITLSLTSITALAALQAQKAGPLIPRLLGYQKRQVNDGSSLTTTDTTSDPGTQFDTFTTDPTTSTVSADTLMMTALGDAAPVAADSSSASTVTSLFTTTIPFTTVTETATITATPTSNPQDSVTTITTIDTSQSTVTVYVTVTPTDSQPSSTSSAATPDASDCAGLNIELGGLPYTAPMGHQYNLQCRSFYYTDDDNTISAPFNVSSYRSCADLCDQDDNCNLYFWGNENAGEQYQQCFLLSSDIYGRNPNSDIADAGVKVGYVSQASPDK